MPPEEPRRPSSGEAPDENAAPRDEGQREQEHEKGSASGDKAQQQEPDGATNEEPDAPPFPDEGAARDYRIAEAEKAVERGWLLTPLNGKAPLHKRWQKAPAPPPDRVEKWAKKGNVGLRTGSVSGVLVLDDDTEDGSGAAELELRATVTVITGSGRRHYYFKTPAEAVTNARGNLPEKVDVRVDGGQVVFVGSIHPDTGGVYCWAPGLSPEEIALAELPDHVVDLIRAPKPEEPKPKKKRTKRRRSVAIDQSARAALDEATSVVAAAPEGSRNETLNCEAFRMGRWVNAGLLTRPEVEAALAGAARAAGLPDSEVARTIRSGLDAGLTQPLRHRHHLGDASVAPKPSIIIEGGALPKIVTQAEDALLQAGAHLYQRGNILVRTMRAPTMTMRDVYRRAEGVLMLCPVESPYLVEILTKAANWYRIVRDDLVLIDCPERVARTYLARAGHWRLRYLLGVIETPTLRPDGSILNEPGYDPTTCLLFDPGAVEFPAIPEEPTRDDALLALAVLREVIKDFPWLEDCDRSAALGAILTALIRPSLRTAPLCAYRAPKMASGKSLLADVVAMIATGRVASVMSQGRDEDEDKKRMLAILMEGIGVACIDNIEREFGGATLCSVLTQESWRERILGKTQTATVPTTTTWLATGNNIRFVGDIVTRVVVCDLDPKCEKPEERVFDVDLHDYVPKHRGELVVAGLTILRAYHVAGRPDQSLPVFGRFEGWSGWVRSALIWLGEADPCAGRARLYLYDPVGSQLRALMTSWRAELKSTSYTVAEALRAARPAEDQPAGPLYEAIVAVAAGPGGKPIARRLGSYLAKYERRAEGGMRIERVGERQGVALWRVVDTDPAPEARDQDPESVGFVGLVGPFQRGDGENMFSDSVDDAGGEASEHVNDDGNVHGFHPGSAGNLPRNPRNPPSTVDGSAEEAES